MKFDMAANQHALVEAPEWTLPPPLHRRCVRGSFDPYLQKCVCDYGWAGARCESFALSSCLLRGSNRTLSCTTPRPRSCACVSECLAAGAFAAHVPRACFRRRFTRDELSDVPTAEELRCGDAAFFRWEGETGALRFAPARWEEALRLDGDINKVVLPATACDGLCSFRGTCVAAADGGPSSASCRCDMGFGGRRCEQRHEGDVLPTLCYNNCSSRGTCLDGETCACQSGFYGPACAFAVQPALTAWLATSPSALRVYVYNLPRIVLARRLYGSDVDRQELFSTMQHLLPMLLADGHTLTRDPEDADLFVVPAPSTNMEGLTSYHQHVLAYIRAEQPRYYARRTGADHVWFCSADHGGDVMASVSGISRGIVYAHYFKEHSLSQHVSAAPYMGVGLTAASADVYANFGTPAWDAATARRTTTFFFAGNLQLRDAASGYSEGVRQQLHFEHGQRAGYRIVEHSASYWDDYRTSVFCAAPLGEGWGNRLLWAVALGCIPVLFESNVHQFWAASLNYSSFSLLVAKPDIPRLHLRLASVSDAQRNDLRRGLFDHHRLFLWDRPYGLAYSMSLLELCERAKRLPESRQELECPRVDQLLPTNDGAAPANGPAPTVAESHMTADVAELAAAAPRAATHGTNFTRCSAECSAHTPLYVQIDSDLDVFAQRGGITEELISSAMARWPETAILATVLIHDGVMYFSRPTGEDGQLVAVFDPMLRQTLAEIYSLITKDLRSIPPRLAAIGAASLPRLPDMEFIINADDYGRPRLRDTRVLPLLSITKVLGEGADILYPTGHYNSVSIGAIIDDIGKLTPTSGELVRRYRKYPWATKTSKAFFRGNPNSHSRSRYALAHLVKHGPEKAKFAAALDVGLTWYKPEHDYFATTTTHAAGSLPPLSEVPRVNESEHGHYKYLLSLDGHSYSHRLLKLLSLNSAVLKEASNEIEFYYHMLQPFVHFLPFSIKVQHERRWLSDITTNVTEAVDYARRNDAQMRRIAAQAQELVHTHLCSEARLCYLHQLLTRYAKLMRYRSSPSMRPGARRVTGIAHGHLQTEPTLRESGVKPYESGAHAHR